MSSRPLLHGAAGLVSLGHWVGPAVHVAAAAGGMAGGDQPVPQPGRRADDQWLRGRAKKIVARHFIQRMNDPRFESENPVRRVRFDCLVILRIMSPRFLSWMTSDDVASIICKAMVRGR